MTESVCMLDDSQREIVENTIADHWRIRKWELHAVNCRTNHVHVIVSAELAPEGIRDQFKAWCTRKLKANSRVRVENVRKNWWTEGGSQSFIGDQESLELVIRYVLECQ